MSTHSGVKDTDFDVEDSTKPQLEPIEVQLADDLVKLSEGYQDPSQVIDGGVDPEASIDLRRGARPRTLTVKGKGYKLEGVKKRFNSQISTLLRHCIFVNGLLSEESLILPRLKQEQAKLEGLLGDLVDTFNELEVLLEGEVDPQLLNKFESAQHNTQDVLNALSTEIRQMMQEIRSNKSGSSRVSRASRASKLVEAAAELAEKKTRLKYLQIEAEQNAKLAQIKAAKELEIAQARVDALSGVGRGSDIGIGDDPKLKEVDKDYLVNKYLSDHQDSGANEGSSQDSLVQTLCKQLNLSRLPAPEPGVFTGDPLHYPSWKKAFDTLISTRAIPDEERLHYLKKYLGGDAKSCVEGYFLLVTPNAYEDACKLLDSRFGDSYMLAKAFRDKLEKWPKVAPRDSPALRKFVDFLKQCETGMQSIPSLSILNDDFEHRRILGKLPDWLVTRWSRLALSWRKKMANPLHSVNL